MFNDFMASIFIDIHSWWALIIILVRYFRGTTFSPCYCPYKGILLELGPSRVPTILPKNVPIRVPFTDLCQKLTKNISKPVYLFKLWRTNCQKGYKLGHIFSKSPCKGVIFGSHSPCIFIFETGDPCHFSTAHV